MQSNDSLNPIARTVCDMLTSIAAAAAYAASIERPSGGLIAIVSGANMDFSRLGSIAERVEKPHQLDRALGVSLEPLASALTATLADPKPKCA